MADEAAEFWSAFEKETGEKVESRAIGEYYREEDASTGLWGLLVLTGKSFRFKHMPSENWLSSIFKRMDRGSKPKEPVEITIPRESVTAIHSPKRSFFARLFGPAFPKFTVTQSVAFDGAGEKQYVFSVDPSGGFLTALEKAFTSQQG
jgi:hypothetical protein